jgi:hypothetical protein
MKASAKGQKVKMHISIKIFINNERGMNTLTKRQQLAKSWEEEK